MSVHDVATFVLEELGPMSAMKLQKLVYYAQAWTVVKEGTPLFPEPIEAWAQGPVVYPLFEQHRGQFVVSSLRKGDRARLPSTKAQLVREVLAAYGAKSGLELSELTHEEAPWCDARRGAPKGLRSRTEIPISALARFYGTRSMPARTVVR